MEPYLEGKTLWADDFSSHQIRAWFADEAEASVDLREDRLRGEYPWIAQQDYHCFSRIPHRRWSHILGFGSAFGQELRPLDAERCTIVESSRRYSAAPELQFPVDYLDALPSGDIGMPSAAADLIVCFGVLHHVPNVSHVLSEFGRVCKRHGYAVIVEPCISMGDWTRPRRGLTPRERGIPRGWMVNQLPRSGFSVRRVAYCDSPAMHLLWKGTRRPPHRVKAAVVLDAAMCRALAWHAPYHATTKLQKIRPRACAYVAQRS